MPIDYTKYAKNWKNEIRLAVLERAKHCCDICGVKNRSFVHRHSKGVNDWTYWPEGMESEAWSLDGKKCTQIVLTIAHIDHDVSNNCHSNLAALCQRCYLHHAKAHHGNNAKATRMQKMGMADLFEQ